MKIAFIILTHRNPAQLERLLRRIAHPGIDCYVHIDAKCNLDEWKQALNLPGVFTVLPRTDIKWAGYGMVEATFDCMRQIRNSGMSYNYITMLSGQDYPIKTAEEIFRFLSRPSTKQYIGIIPETELAMMMSKVNNYHLVDLTFPGKFKLADLMTKLLPARKPPLRMKIYSGSQWWTLTEDCAYFILDHMERHPAISRYFKLTWGPDEFIFQTILMNSKYKNEVTGYDLHYIDWSEGKEHPKMLSAEDLPAMAASPLLFARKFDMDKDPGLLDLIDRELIGNM